MVQLCEAVYVSATFQYDFCTKYLYEEVQLMQMVVDKEGSVKEEQFKSVAEITWKEAITIKILLWQKRRGVVFWQLWEAPALVGLAKGI